MPPEPLQWDEKDFFKERKQERSESLGSFSRWRDSSFHHGHRDFSRRGSSDFRRPPGHSKQGGWNQFPEETDLGYAPPRSTSSHGEGKYGRSSRKVRGSFSQRDWTGHSSETCNGSPNTPGRPADVNNEQRLVDVTPIYPSYPQSALVNKCDELQLKNQNDKMGCVQGLGTGQRGDREKSLGSADWKSLKWTRSVNLSTRGSSFSHSNSSKSLAGVDPNDAKAELQPKNEIPIQSSSGEAAAFVNSDVPSEDMISRKKPRLGWGEGLAKYEKKKVEGPDETINRTDVVCSTNIEPIHSLITTMADRSPTDMGFSDCVSPATPLSVVCSSPLGLENKSYVKASTDNGLSNLCASPGPGSQYHLEGFSFDIEKLDINSISSLGSTLVTLLLHSDDPSTVDSSFERSTAMNKLLVFKGDILKAVEMTESEIDSLENELKLLRCESGCPCPCPATSISLPCQELDVPSDLTLRPAPLQIVSSEDAIVEKKPNCSGAMSEVHTDGKYEEIDSPGSATSKFSESLSLVKEVSPSNIGKNGGYYVVLDATQIPNIEVESSLFGSNGEKIFVSACGGDEKCSMLRKSNNVAVVFGDKSLKTDGEDDTLYEFIVASNKDFASRASEELIKRLPSELCNIDISEVVNVLRSQQTDSFREKFALNQLFLLHKERVATLKFKALQHLWKEDLRLLSLKKRRAKSQKKFESSLQTSSGYKKHRSSIQSQFSSPAGNLSLVPTTEMNNLLSELLVDFQVKRHRNTLKMPEFNLNKSDVKSRMICRNGLVEDPCVVEKERVMINPWLNDEIEIFKDKLATFGKNFRKIASFLTHKTTADCIEFYYKNHKSSCFEKTKTKPDIRKEVSTFMVTSGNKWDREKNAVSLEMLGEASVIAACARSSKVNQQMGSGRFFLGGNSNSRMPRGDDILRRSSSFEICGNERETVAADVLAGMCNSMSSEAMSSCITSSADPGEGNRERKFQKVDSVTKRPLTPDVTQNVDDETCSDESCGAIETGNWTDEEKSIFVRAVSSYGNDFAMISRLVRTRSRDQCRVFFSKARKCLGLDLIRHGCADDGSPMSDANGDGSDGSVICSDNKMGSIVEKDLPPVVMDTIQDEYDPAKIGNLPNDLNNSEETDAAENLDHRDASRVETLVADTCQTGDRPYSNAVKEVVDPIQSNSNAVFDSKAAMEVSSEGFVKELEGCQDLMSEILNNKQGEKCQSDTIKLNLDIQYLTQNLETMRNVSHLATSTSSCPGFSTTTDTCHQDLIHLNSIEKSNTLRGETSLATANSVAQNLVAVNCEKKRSRDGLSSTLEFHQGRDEKKSGHSMKPVKSSRILSGHPLQMPTEKGMIECISCGQLSKSERKLTGRYLAEDCYLQKGNSLKPHSSVAELPMLSQNTERKSDCDTDKRCGNGDVKLFGKILSPPQLPPKLNSNATENAAKGTQLPESIKTPNPKVNGQPNVNGNSALLKFDCNNYLGLENHPVRSYGFWDGNRLQTGFSSLPDSAVSLARYPAAFRSYPISPSNMDPQLLQTGQLLHTGVSVRSSEQNFNGAMVYPARAISSDTNGVVDSPVYRGWDVTKLHPFTVDLEQ